MKKQNVMRIAYIVEQRENNLFVFYSSDRRLFFDNRPYSKLLAKLNRKIEDNRLFLLEKLLSRSFSKKRDITLQTKDKLRKNVPSYLASIIRPGKDEVDSFYKIVSFTSNRFASISFHPSPLRRTPQFHFYDVLEDSSRSFYDRFFSRTQDSPQLRFTNKSTFGKIHPNQNQRRKIGKYKKKEKSKKKRKL